MLVKELPNWLQKRVKKELNKRMSRADAELWMNSTLEALTELMENSSKNERKVTPERELAEYLINRFFEREYGKKAESFEGTIDLAYSTEEDGSWVQARLNLEEKRLFIERGNEKGVQIVFDKTYDTMIDLIRYELNYLDYDALVSIEYQEERKEA